MKGIKTQKKAKYVIYEQCDIEACLKCSERWEKK